MPTVTEFDTIAAISTPPGEGAIGIVRLSGDAAVALANEVFQGPDLETVATHTIHYGHLVQADETTVDEVMVSVMRAPKTYTREDIVEINCHGGIVATNRVLQLLLGNGARLAEPGEFTKRAFLNGRIDLTEAESVMDLIRAKTDRAMQVALGQLDGNLRHLITNLRQEILETLAQVEVNIDYPEYDMEAMTAQLLQEKARLVQTQVKNLLATAKQGTILREGLATAIVGRPNVGKSSLLNHMLHQEKAIVTDVPGTTRDVLEEYVNVRGVPLKLIDTAGIRETDDKVEKIGVERSRAAIVQADLVLLILDASVPLSEADRELITATEGKPRLILLNKEDLPRALDRTELVSLVPDATILSISALAKTGLDELDAAIQTRFMSGIANSQTTTLVTNARQIGLLMQADTSLTAVLEGLEAGMPIDLVQIDMTSAWEALGEITGEAAPDELITQLFTQFCVGK